MKRFVSCACAGRARDGGARRAAEARWVDPAKFSQPPTTSWPTYNGDYSGRRFSPLTKVTDGERPDRSAWRGSIATAPGLGGGVPIKGTPVMIDGVLYLTLPDHVWALDARTGRELWHYAWESKGGIHIGNRGVAVAGDSLYFETPDCHLVSLGIKDGKERWRKEICDLDQFYYGSVAPVVVKGHVIAGVSGDDLDIPGYVQSHDPESGEMQWRWYVVPQKMGEPGSETWPNEDAMKHGGGMTWQPITYDPELNLIYVTTGNPQPVIAHKNRAGANLYTGSIVALNPDTGKMVWAFQSSPHDTHDWDSTQTPVLIDGEFNGQPRKLLAQAARNGHYFLLDRATGKALVSAPYVKTNWSKGYDAKGQPIPNPAKDPQIDGALVDAEPGRRHQLAATELQPADRPALRQRRQAYSVYYIYDPSDNPQGWGGTDRGGYAESMLQAIDYKTGKVRWSHKWEGNIRAGVLSTAGNVVFTGGTSNDLVALNATTASGALAGAPELLGRERSDHLRARWTAVRAGGGGRYVVDVCDEREG